MVYYVRLAVFAVLPRIPLHCGLQRREAVSEPELSGNLMPRGMYEQVHRQAAATQG